MRPQQHPVGELIGDRDDVIEIERALSCRRVMVASEYHEREVSRYLLYAWLQ